MTEHGDFFEILDNRRTVRDFVPYEITDSEIERIINSARLAPSAVNAQNWKFLAIVNDDVKEKMAVAVVEKYNEIIAKIDDEAVKTRIKSFINHSTFFTTASLVVAVVEVEHPRFLQGVLEDANYTKEEIDIMRPDSQLLSVGGAIENMALASSALGLGSCWMVAPILAHEEFAKILGTEKNEKIVSLLAIGKPKEVLPSRAPKKPLADVMKIIK
ncbi:nitroreductase family protein [bacterium]|nr:nitroreductase family protein [bacterium]